MARNAPDPSRRTTSSRVTKAPVVNDAPPTWATKKGRGDRRLFWIRVMVGFLVFSMLAPIIIYFVS